MNKIKIFVLLTLLVGASSVMAQQESRFKKTKGTLSIQFAVVEITGYNGEEVIISRNVQKKDKDERAQGLSSLTSTGFVDKLNDVGVTVQHFGDTTQLSLGTRMQEDTIRLMVPKNLNILIKEKGVFILGEQFIKGKSLNGNLEISLTNGDLELENITGPITANTVRGNISALFSQPIQGPITLNSSWGFVDVTVPPQVKANLLLRTTTGEFFADKELNISVKNEESSVGDKQLARALSRLPNSVSLFSDSVSSIRIKLDGVPKGVFEGGFTTKVVGELNGGGTDIILGTTMGNVYLRKGK